MNALNASDRSSNDFVAPVLSSFSRAMALVLLGVGATLFLGLSPLVAHESWLACSGPQTCAHVERYPFGYERQQPLPPISSADTEWSPGGRSRALKLVLSHTDGSFTEYQGVGANGERAPRVAKAINSFLQQPQGTSKFELREGSVVVGVFLVLISLILLAASTQVFAKVRLHISDGVLVVTRERWPLPQGVQRFALPDVKEFSLRKLSVLGTDGYRIFVETQTTGFYVGLGGANPDPLGVTLSEINAWFRKHQ